MSIPSEEIDKRVDQRLSILRDSIELNLSKAMDQTFKSRLESTAKVLGWAFGLVALVFAGFGIKTVYDVRDIARSTAVEEVKKTLAIDDPNSDFRRDIDKVVARGLIDSYLLSLAKSNQNEFHPDLAISENDLRRLQNLVNDPRTSEKDFSDAFEVLLKSEQRSRDQSIDRLVQALASGSDPKYRWTLEQPEKRAALFRLYTGDRLVQIAREILGDSKAERQLLVAAIKYAGSKDVEAAKLLEPLTKHRDHDVSTEAQFALARVDPKSDALKLAIDKLAASNQAEGWMVAVRIAVEIAKPSQRRFLEDDPDYPDRKRIAAGIFQDVINHDFVFRLSSDFDDRSTASLYLSSSKSSTLYGISADVIRGAASTAIDEMLRNSASDSGLLLRNLRALCLEDDGQCWGVVRVNWGNGGGIILQNGVKIEKENAPAGVTLRSTNTGFDSSIRVTWTDADAIAKSGILAQVSDPDHVDFSVATTRTLGRSDEGD